VVGVSVAVAEARLKEIEDEILEESHNLRSACGVRVMNPLLKGFTAAVRPADRRAPGE
jgi:hypothetical protein